MGRNAIIWLAKVLWDTLVFVEFGSGAEQCNGIMELFQL